MPIKKIPVSSDLLNKRIGENIEQMRLQKKKSTKEMASLLDLTHTGYRNIERGKTEISVTKIYKIAKILNINFIRLLDFENSFSLISDDKILNSQISETLKHYKDEIIFLRRQLELLHAQDIFFSNRLKPAK